MDFSKVKENLETRGYRVACFPTAAEATEYLAGAIQKTTVAFGGSLTIDEMGLYDRLIETNKVIWHWRLPAGMTASDARREAMTTTVYVSSVNGLAETGEIVNIDGSGNRVASIFYGHQRVYLVIGRNKLAPDLHQAIHRARNIAAPKNAQRLGVKTPCAAKGDRCHDCDSPARICRGLEVLWRPMTGAAFEVVLIDEDLGY
ncbi:MAG: lactate utilization protein [Schwartzia sp.]|nr:lactate utilization protein [Schwartzia sp. (in: firmicutes)]